MKVPENMKWVFQFKANNNTVHYYDLSTYTSREEEGVKKMVDLIYSSLPVLNRPKFVSMAKNYFPEYRDELITKRDEEFGNGIRTA